MGDSTGDKNSESRNKNKFDSIEFCGEFPKKLAPGVIYIRVYRDESGRWPTYSAQIKATKPVAYTGLNDETRYSKDFDTPARFSFDYEEFLKNVSEANHVTKISYKLALTQLADILAVEEKRRLDLEKIFGK